MIINYVVPNYGTALADKLYDLFPERNSAESCRHLPSLSFSHLEERKFYTSISYLIILPLLTK